jgi:hypothetical protein
MFVVLRYVVLITVLFSVNSQDFFGAAANDYIAGVAATPFVLAHLR